MSSKDFAPLMMAIEAKYTARAGISICTVFSTKLILTHCLYRCDESIIAEDISSFRAATRFTRKDSL